MALPAACPGHRDPDAHPWRPAPSVVALEAVWQVRRCPCGVEHYRQLSLMLDYESDPTFGWELREEALRRRRVHLENEAERATDSDLERLRSLNQSWIMEDLAR